MHTHTHTYICPAPTLTKSPHSVWDSMRSRWSDLHEAAFGPEGIAELIEPRVSCKSTPSCRRLHV